MNAQRHPFLQEKRTFHPFLVSCGLWLALLCWGSSYVAARFLLSPQTVGLVTLSPILLATLRFGIASLFFVFPLLRAVWHHEVSGHRLLLMGVLGQVTFTFYYWLQYLGIQRTSAGISAILGVGLIPLFTTLLAPLFGKERWSFPLLCLLLFGFGGVALVILQQPLAISIHSGFLLGAGCFLVNTFFFALYNHVSKQWMQDSSPVVFTAGTMSSGVLGLLFVSLLDPQSHWDQVSHLQAPQWGAILFLAVACSVLAYFAYNVALQSMDASRVAVYFYGEPVISLVLGAVLLGEQVGWQTVVGASVILCAIVVAQRIHLPASASRSTPEEESH